MHPWIDNGDAPLPAQPQLKPWYRQAVVGDALVLEHGHAAVVFAGAAAVRLLPVLLPLLDGTRTVAAIVSELGTAAEPAVLNALRLLQRRDLLLDGDGSSDGGTDAATLFLAAIGRGVTVAAVRAALAQAEVAVAGASPVADLLVDLLRRSGADRAARASWDELSEVSEGKVSKSNAPFVVASPAGDEVDRLAAWNRGAVASGTPWLQVLPFDGRFAAVGPLYVPGESCCYECYRSRRVAASGYGDELRALDEVPTRAGSTPAFEAVVAGVAAGLALRWLVHLDHYLPGVFYACEAGGTGLTQHRVYRAPRCAVCSGARDAAPPLPWFKEVAADDVLEAVR
jgi:bacteriocin biosynthesis cyclodehydratase domain-containing protein